MKKFQYFDKAIGSAFVLALAFSLGDHASSGMFLASSTEIAIIPKSGSLGNAFATGNFNFSHILQYGMYLIKIMGVLAGIIYMFMNIIAGIKYITGSVSGDEEDAKNTMVNALIGFALAVFSWIFVDILLTLVT